MYLWILMAIASDTMVMMATIEKGCFHQMLMSNTFYPIYILFFAKNLQYKANIYTQYRCKSQNKSNILSYFIILDFMKIAHLNTFFCCLFLYLKVINYHVTLYEHFK